MHRIILVLLLFISSYQGFSQAKLGVKTGTNVSTVMANKTFPGSEHWDIEEPRIGYYLGVFYSKPLNNKFSLQPELLVSLKGYNSVSTHPDKYRYIMNFYYINLPLLLSYKPIAKITLLAGPEFGLLLRAKLKGDYTEGWHNSNNYKKGDFGIAIGLNYNILPNWSIEGRYNHGLTNLTEFEKIKDTRNRVWQVGVAYTL